MLPCLVGFYGFHGENWMEADITFIDIGHFFGALWGQPIRSPHTPMHVPSAQQECHSSFQGSGQMCYMVNT